MDHCQPLLDDPHLSGYYTTYPALDADGTAVFWRDGALLAIDADLHQRDLFTMTDDRAVMTKILPLDQGTITFTLDNELKLADDMLMIGYSYDHGAMR